jgi:hypothetical protein
MATAGVVIALAAVAEEDMSAAAATVVTALMQPTADTVHRERALAAREARGPRRRVAASRMLRLAASPMLRLTAPPHTVELLTVEVADPMAAVNIASLS